jgi:hypothetical protein
MSLRYAVMAFVLASVSTAHAAGPVRKLKVGLWSGGSFFNDTTRKFSHCAASASYINGVTLHVSVTSEGVWLLGLSKRGANLSAGGTAQLKLLFAGIGSVDVNARIRSPELVTIDMPTNSEVLRAFRSAHQMQVSGSGLALAFNLNETSRLMPALVECVDSKGQVRTAARIDGQALPVQKPMTREPQPNHEAVQEREKLLTEAAREHTKCRQSQMRNIVPYSNESAETLAQVVLTNCKDAEDKFVSLGVALLNMQRSEVQTLLSNSLVQEKSRMVAEIVTFRAELAKAIAQQPKADSPKVEDASKNERGI